MRVRFETNIRKATDSCESRCALDSVQVFSAGEGKVYAVATDGRQISVQRCVGEAEGSWLIPASMLLNKKGMLAVWDAENGRLENSDGSVGKPGEGRFPKTSDSFPKVDEGYRRLYMDLAVLNRVAAALGTMRLVLLVPPEGKGEGCVVSPMPVLPGEGDGLGVVNCRVDTRNEGFGLLCVISREGDATEEYERRRKAFVRAHAELRREAANEEEKPGNR